MARARPERESPAPELEGLHPKAWRRHGRTLVGLIADAANDDTPLLERLKFLCIVANFLA